MLWFILTEKCHISCPICQKYGAAVLWNAFPVDKLKLFCYTFVTIVTILLPAAFSAAAPERKFDRYEKTSFQRSVRCFAGSVAERNGPGLHLFRHADGRGGRRGNPCTAHHPRAITPAAPGQEADRIVLSAPTAGAAVEIPINGKASDADLLLVDKQGLYEAAEDTVRGESTVSTMLPGTRSTVLILKKPPFTDLSRTAWYYGGVVYAYHNQLMSGVSSTKFSPNSAADRAMLVTILHRTAGKPAADGGGSFADVPGGKYYSAAVSWAAGEGIVTGSGSGNFNPTGKLTREQLAVVLYRYAQYEGRDVSRRADLGAYKDGAKVSSWAKDAMSWAVAEGLITGSNQKNLTPGGSTNRAQLATILMRYCA